MGMMIGIGVPGVNRDVVQWTASIIHFILIFSATVRRLHDTGRSGWWFILYFIPVIGDLVLLIFTVQKGNEGENQFGPDPKQDEVSLIDTRDDKAQTDLSV
ncbi:inner membrane protein [Escherichia coli]|nr:inner membrane protein [Escherichia coli]